MQIAVVFNPLKKLEQISEPSLLSLETAMKYVSRKTQLTDSIYFFSRSRQDQEFDIRLLLQKYILSQSIVFFVILSESSIFIIIMYHLELTPKSYELKFVCY
jgi:hypothetical protein